MIGVIWRDKVPLCTMLEKLSALHRINKLILRYQLSELVDVL